MPRPPYPQLQQVLANDELPAEVLLRRDGFLNSCIAGHDMIENESRYLGHLCELTNLLHRRVRTQQVCSQRLLRRVAWRR
jgi:hypothetical protein